MSAAIARAMLLRAGEWGRIQANVDLESPPYVFPDGAGGLAERQIADPARPPMAEHRHGQEPTKKSGKMLPP